MTALAETEPEPETVSWNDIFSDWLSVNACDVAGAEPVIMAGMAYSFLNKSSAT